MLARRRRLAVVNEWAQLKPMRNSYEKNLLNYEWTRLVCMFIQLFNAKWKLLVTRHYQQFIKRWCDSRESAIMKSQN